MIDWVDITNPQGIFAGAIVILTLLGYVSGLFKAILNFAKKKWNKRREPVRISATMAFRFSDLSTKGLSIWMTIKSDKEVILYPEITYHCSTPGFPISNPTNVRPIDSKRVEYLVGRIPIKEISKIDRTSFIESSIKFKDDSYNVTVNNEKFYLYEALNEQEELALSALKMLMMPFYPKIKKSDTYEDICRKFLETLKEDGQEDALEYTIDLNVFELFLTFDRQIGDEYPFPEEIMQRLKDAEKLMKIKSFGNFTTVDNPKL